MGIGKRLREARENKGWTQYQLAEKIGTTPSSITNYEKDTSHPKEPILYKLIEVLEVDANFLFQDNVPANATDSLLFTEKKLLHKYRELDSHGQQMVNTVVDMEHDRCSAAGRIAASGQISAAGQIAASEQITTAEFTPEHTPKAPPVPAEPSVLPIEQERRLWEDKPYLIPQAAHNDYENDPQEQELMKKDIEKLKKLKGK